MDLVINNIKIKPDIKIILNSLKQETNNKYFNIIEDKGVDIVCQCPFHKDGREKKPACFIYNNTSDPNIEFGTYHCFACGAKGKLESLVGFCLDLQKEEAETWLINNFGTSYIEEVKTIDKFEFGKKINNEYLDESILKTFEYNNRMLLRKVMMQAGFAPYDGEWWHFSYGDKEWAYYYKKKRYLYPQVNKEDVYETI